MWYADLRFVIFFFLFLALPAQGGTFVFSIDSQEEFGQMNTALTKAIEAGEKDIVVDIAEGVYYYRANHVFRRYENFPDVSVRIEGHDAVLIAQGNDYRDGDSYEADFDPYASFIDMESLTAFDFWDDCRYAEGMAEVADEETKLCRLPIPQAEMYSDCSQLYVNIPQWFYSRTYKVESVEDGYIYFTVNDLKHITREDRTSINVNYDYLFGKQDTRFRLCYPALNARSHVQIVGNKVKAAPDAVIHECRVARFLYCGKSSFKTFTISGLHFLGNSSGDYLMMVDGVETDSFTIERCRFDAIKGFVLWAKDAPNITFSHNHVEHCQNGISATHSCENTRVVGNMFRDCGENMMQTFCVNCKGKDYYIAHNKFCNYGYSAVCLGMWLGYEGKVESSGIVEYNEMWLEPDYIAHKERYTLQDTGAIYLSPQHDMATVRYNYIHDIDGILYNRGIFCDDGASHFRVYGNVVMGVANSYSIESRNCENKLEGGNTDIRIEHNIVDTAIKFEGSSKGDNGCVVSGNVMLCREGEVPPENVYSRLTTESPDRQMTFWGYDEDGIVVDRRQMERLGKLGHYDSAIKAAKWRYK